MPANKGLESSLPLAALGTLSLNATTTPCKKKACKKEGKKTFFSN